jgi:hypothetical protein
VLHFEGRCHLLLLLLLTAAANCRGHCCCRCRGCCSRGRAALLPAGLIAPAIGVGEGVAAVAAGVCCWCLCCWAMLLDLECRFGCSQSDVWKEVKGGRVGQEADVSKALEMVQSADHMYVNAKSCCFCCSPVSTLAGAVGVMQYCCEQGKLLYHGRICCTCNIGCCGCKASASTPISCKCWCEAYTPAEETLC